MPSRVLTQSLMLVDFTEGRHTSAGRVVAGPGAVTTQTLS